MITPTEYVLGTCSHEIARLGLQHRVWRPYMLDAWQRAGVTCGSHMLDLGAGPGYATVDAAEIVGAAGRVTAIEKSNAFVEFGRGLLQSRTMTWAQVVELDVMEDEIGESDFDLAWCRWVASFVSRPTRLIDQIGRALKPGGRVIFHEYQNYSTWRITPSSSRFDEFVREVIKSWRESGGEPDIAFTLAAALPECGFRIASLKPIVFTATPRDYVWKWPAAFVETNSRRLQDLGRVTNEWATEVRHDFEALAGSPASIMMTPTVLEIIAERL